MVNIYIYIYIYTHSFFIYYLNGSKRAREKRRQHSACAHRHADLERESARECSHEAERGNAPQIEGIHSKDVGILVIAAAPSHLILHHVHSKIIVCTPFVDWILYVCKGSRLFTIASLMYQTMLHTDHARYT